MKKPRKLGINEFYDINKFPKSYGLTVTGISMPLIENKQSPRKLFESQMALMPKIVKPLVGAIMYYSDGLYLNSNDSATSLKWKFQEQIEKHKSGMRKLIYKDIYLIRSAFNFLSWSQIILSCPKFSIYFKKVKSLYDKDLKMQEYVRKDIIGAGRRVNNNTINYILEENLLDYLISMKEVRLQNDFVQDKEKWVLNYYPGKPHRTGVYLYQKNPFKMNSDNPYKGCWYDTSRKVLYEYDRLDIDSFEF